MSYRRISVTICSGHHSNDMKKPLQRCPWCPPGDTLYEEYHDHEWGRPLHDGGALFELLNLEGAQAGLSWRTVLAKRDHYQKRFEGFDPVRLAQWGDREIQDALGDSGIIRNRLKVRAVVTNSRALLEQFGDLGAFSEWIWSFVDHQPQSNRFRTLSDYPSRTDTSDRMSKELKRRGFTFVGSTICYAFMQSSGMVNDHSIDCSFREVTPRRSKV